MATIAMAPKKKFWVIGGQFFLFLFFVANINTISTNISIFMLLYNINEVAQKA